MLSLLLLPACSLDFYKENLNLGIKAARMRLWKEALYRFQRAAAIKETAQAYNNMAVAYEALGDFEKAEECYKKALSLDPQNRLIRANYAIFLELKRKGKGQEKGQKRRKEK